MKTFLKLRGCPALALLLSCLLSLAADSPKPAKPEAKPKPTTDAQINSGPWQRRLAEFHADGLPLLEVANSLSEQFPEVNFVLDPAVKETMVALKLRSVTLEDIFTAIGITTQTGSGAIDPSTGLPIKGAIQVNKLSDRMVSFTERQTPAPEITKPICRAFSLARYLAGKTETEAGQALEGVEQVLELSWSMLRDADPSSTKIETPRLNLHRATKLLVVVGQPDQIEVVQQVIGQLEGGGGVAGDPVFGAPGVATSETARAFATRYGLPVGLPGPPRPTSTNPPAQAR